MTIVLSVLVSILFAAFLGIFVAEWGFDKPALTEAFMIVAGIAFLGIAVCLPIAMM